MCDNEQNVYYSPTSKIKIFLDPKSKTDDYRPSCFYNEEDEDIFEGFFSFNSQQVKETKVI